MLDAPTGEVLALDTAAGTRTVLATLSPGLDNIAFDYIAFDPVPRACR